MLAAPPSWLCLQKEGLPAITWSSCCRTLFPRLLSTFSLSILRAYCRHMGTLGHELGVGAPVQRPDATRIVELYAMLLLYGQLPSQHLTAARVQLHAKSAKLPTSAMLSLCTCQALGELTRTSWGLLVSLTS